MSHKTKATPKDRQWHRTKPIQNSRYQVGGLEKIRRPQIEEAGECRQLTTVGRTKKCTLPGYQPFGSMPRCCNSLRMIRFIQAAKDSSPSSCCAVSIISRKSGSKRNWKGGFPRLSFLCVDTSITPCVEYVYVMTHYTHDTQKATPRSVQALPRRLTTSDNTVSR